MPKSILDDVPKRIWVKNEDKEALTIEELVKETGEGRNWAERFVKDGVQSGRYEVVWKRPKGGKPVRAYRRKK